MPQMAGSWRSLPRKRLDALVEEAVVDAYGESEQLVGLLCMLQEHLAVPFMTEILGIAVRVERSGAERIFQRIGQEYSANIHAVDVVNSSDAAQLIFWKREGMLAPFVPEDVAKHYPAEHRDPDGMFATWRMTLSVIA